MNFKSYLCKNGLLSILFLFFLFTYVSADRILLVCEESVNANNFERYLEDSLGHQVTVTPTIPAILSINDYEQFWIALYKWPYNAGDYEPVDSTRNKMYPFLQAGGKIALFCDHSNGGGWVEALAAQQNISAFVNSVVPDDKKGQFSIEKSPSSGSKIEVNLSEAMLANPTGAAEFASNEYDVHYPGNVLENNLAGGYGVLHVKGETTKKVGIAFNANNLHSTYSSGRLFVFTDLGNALTGLFSGNTPILKFIASFTTGAVSNVSISPTIVEEDTLNQPAVDNSYSIDLNVILEDTLDTVTTIEYILIDSTATYGATNDYYGNSGAGGILTFQPGDTLKTITITIVDDNIHEGDHYFKVQLFDAIPASKIKFTDGNQQTFVITIQDEDPANVAPDAIDDNASVNEGASTDINVLSNDTDEDKTSIVVSIQSNATYGTLIVNADKTIKYTHDGTEHFTDSFKYKITDQAGEVDSATVYVTINPINDNTPNAVNKTYSVIEGATLDTNGVLAGNTDIDVDQTNTTAYDWLHASLKSSDSTSYGTLTLNSNGSFTYVHDGSNETATADTFTYYSIDSLGHKDSATVIINIVLQNDNAPVTVVDTIVVDEGDSTSLLKSGQTSVLFNDTDADGKAGLTATKVSDPSYGIIAFNSNGTFTYQHNGTENFNDSFTYTASDGVNTSTAGTVVIIINPVNDNTPVAVKDSIVVNEGAAISSLYNSETNVLWNDTDTDLPNDNLTVSVVNGVTNGALLLNLNGTFTYTHNGSESFIDSFSYEVKDAVGHLDTATVKITIIPVNDNTPIATNDAIAVSQGGDTTKLISGELSVLSNDTDPDTNDVLTVSLIIDVTHGTLTLNSDGTFIYTHDGGVTLTDEFTYEVSDLAGHKDTAVVSITAGATNTNDPVAVKDSIATTEGNSVSVLVSGNLSVLDNDTDADMPYDNLTATIFSDVTYGDLTLNTNGTFTYKHDGSENFADNFIYQVEDAAGHTDTITVNISIAPVNDNTPVVQTDTIIVDEGGTATTLKDGETSLLTNASDIDYMDTLKVDSVSVDVSNGTLLVNSDGTFSYTHDGSTNFSDQFTFVVSDLAGAQATGNIIIIINELNDNAPVSVVDSIIVAEGDTATTLTNGNTSVLTNDSDADGMDAVIALLVSDVQYGTLTFDSNGTFIYIHDDSENFIDSFTYQANDGVQNGNTVTVYINITPINDNKPFGQNDSIVVSEGGITTVLYDNTLSVLDNDSDDDINTTLIAILADSVTYGDIYFLEDGTFSYDHDGSENFTDYFTYLVSDGDSLSDTITVKITIIPVNDNLTVTAKDSMYLIEGQSQTVLYDGSTSVLDNDTDIDGMTGVTVLLVKEPLHGTIILNSDGTFKYQHFDNNENYEDYFTYVAIDGSFDTTDVETVSIEIEPIPKPSKAYEAEYYDIDGNGVIDSLHFKFTKPIVLKDSNGVAITTFEIQWEKTTFALNLDSSNFNDDKTIMTVNPSSYLDATPRTSGTMYLLGHYLLNDPVNNKDTLYNVINIVEDKAAPVLTRAEYQFRQFENPDDPAGSDSAKFDALIIDFSEEVKSINGSYPFNFQKNNSDKNEYQMELDLVSLDSTKAIFKVLSFEGAFYADKNDSTWIFADTADNPSLYIADSYNNRQKAAQNRKVPLILDTPKLELKVQILHIVGKEKSDTEIPDLLQVEGVNFTQGAVIIVSSKNAGNAQEEEDHLNLARKQIAIFDLVGNEVISIDNSNSEYLAMEVKTVSGKPSLVINWNGMNSKGRAVASGSYVVIIKFTEDEMFESKNNDIIEKINVKQFVE